VNMTKRLPYAEITRAAGKHAEDVMNRLPRGKGWPFKKHREHWNVAFEAFKQGARWAMKGRR